jgi:hypothetical protein
MFFHFLQHLGSQQIEADAAQVALVQGDDAVLFEMARIEFDDAGLAITDSPTSEVGAGGTATGR